MRKSRTLIELKYGKLLDDILEKISVHDSYDELVSQARIFFDDLYPYLKIAYFNDPIIPYSILVYVALFTDRSFSDKEISLIAEIVSKSKFGRKYSDILKREMEGTNLSENKSQRLKNSKKALFSFADHLTKDSLVSLVGLLCCFLLCNATIENTERVLLLKLFEANPLYV